MTSGRVSRDTVFQEMRPGAGFETGGFVKKKVGGANAERLVSITGVQVPGRFEPHFTR